jgi:hypothetical protein
MEGQYEAPEDARACPWLADRPPRSAGELSVAPIALMAGLMHCCQEAYLVQKYLGGNGLRANKGYGYPPATGREEGEFTTQMIDAQGKGTHGVPLTNFLNAQYLCVPMFGCYVQPV